MALFSSTTARAPFVFSQNPNKPFSLSSLHFRISLSPRSPRFPSLRFISAAGDTGDAENKSSANISDEWGEKNEPDPEASSSSKFPDSDPPRDEDEWEEGAGADAGGYIDGGNGTPATATEAPAEEGVDEKLEGLKRALVDTVYGTELGFRAGSEIRAEVSELVTQLEAANPTPAPVEEPALLNGNWVLL